MHKQKQKHNNLKTRLKKFKNSITVQIEDYSFPTHPHPSLVYPWGSCTQPRGPSLACAWAIQYIRSLACVALK